jgi:hypothetical protein
MGEKKKGERGLYQRGDTWGISYYFNGKHIRKAIGTKGDARKELTAIRAKMTGARSSRLGRTRLTVW